MIRRWGLMIGCWVAILGALAYQYFKMTGPTPPEVAEPPRHRVTARFFSPWQDEAQFVVTRICSELAQMAHPELGPEFQVVAVEDKFSADHPAYRVSAKLTDGKQISRSLEIKNSIWDPETYRGWCQDLKLHSSPAPGNQPEETIKRLTNPTPLVLAQLDRELSAQGAQRMGDANWHDQAALLLASLALREPSGYFFQIRQELCSLCAHLAMSDSLRGSAAPGYCHLLARAALAALYRREDEAWSLLAKLPEQGGLGAWKRALSLRLSGDYRIQPKGTLLEEREHFMAEYFLGSCAGGWKHRSQRPEWQQLADWTRFAYAHTPAHSDTPGIVLGHELAETSNLAETRELQDVCRGEGWPEPARDGLADFLNSPPERPQAAVLGRQHWGWFLQRQRCHTLVSNFQFLNDSLGDPESAQAYSREASQKYRGLRLLPLAMRHLATDEATYHQALDQAGELIRATPEVVPASAWNELFYSREEFPNYRPHTIRVLNEWHNHNPLPGTAYDLDPRMNHPSLTGRADLLSKLSALNAASPHDPVVYCYLLKVLGEQHKYEARRALQILKPTQDYNADAAFRLATEVGLSDREVELWWKRAIALNPRYLSTLLQESLDSGQMSDYEENFQRWLATEPDPVLVSNLAHAMIDIYEKSGRPQKASELAEQAADTNSYRGLCAKADLLEKRGQWDAALEIYRRVAERYNAPAPLVGGLLRASSRDPKFKAELELESKKIPGGLEAYQPGSQPPQQGLSVSSSEGGLEKDDVVVAIRGYRTQSRAQFDMLKALEPFSRFSLTVYRKGSYQELGPFPTRHDFEGLQAARDGA